MSAYIEAENPVLFVDHASYRHDQYRALVAYLDIIQAPRPANVLPGWLEGHATGPEAQAIAVAISRGIPFPNTIALHFAAFAFQSGGFTLSV
jgi:hypothetical protein